MSCVKSETEMWRRPAIVCHRNHCLMSNAFVG